MIARKDIMGSLYDYDKLVDYLQLIQQETPPPCTHKCSFCHNLCDGLAFESSSFHGEKVEWIDCGNLECFYAKQICREWLQGGGLNDSQSLRDSALTTARRRREAANRRY